MGGTLTTDSTTLWNGDGVKRFGAIVVVLGMMLALTACTSGTGPIAFNYGGQWSGTIQDSLAGNGIVSATLTQSGSDIGGTWQATFAGGGNGGTAVGAINGSQVILELYPSNVSACPYRVVANRSGSTLSGNYAAFNCTGTITGTLTITKQ